VALMIVIVQFGNLTAITAGPAAPAFTVVVIMTILATHSFDTRLLWDKDSQ
jgi:paraquat-inducible protein A